jgi:hypothetical protein
MTIYIVENLQTKEEQLVEADNKAQAFRIVGESLIKVCPAPTGDIVRLMETGKTVLRRIEPQQEIPIG